MGAPAGTEARPDGDGDGEPADPAGPPGAAPPPDRTDPDGPGPDGPGPDGPGPDGPAGWWPRVRSEQVVLVATWLVVALGAALRIRQWWHARSFWLDELLLLRAMSDQKVTEVLQPLTHDQSAPPGWLLVEQFVLTFASGERGARLLPLLFGIGAVALTALLGRTLFGGVAALAATTLVALSTTLIFYSAELKQYSADVFFLQLVLLLAVRVALRIGPPGRARLQFAAAAAVAVWFSHATALAAGGMFLALGLQALARRRWRELALLVAGSVPYAAGLAVEYATVLSANADNEVLTGYWARVLPPEGPLSWTVGWEWFTVRARAVAGNPLHLDAGWLLLALVAAGLVVLLLRRPAALPVLVLAVAAVVAAGLVASYPIADRLALWVIPLAALVLAAPLDVVPLAAGLPLRGIARRVTVGVAVLLALALAGQLAVMVAPWGRQDAEYVAAPREVEEGRPAMQLVARLRQPGDLVVVDRRAGQFAAGFYGPRTGMGDYQLIGADKLRPGCGPELLGSTLRRTTATHVWLVHMHTRQDMVDLYVRDLAQFGPIGLYQPFPGGAVIRFDRSATPPGKPFGRTRFCMTLQPPT